MPPPEAEHSSIAAWMAGPSLVLLSPFAPVLVTLHIRPRQGIAGSVRMKISEIADFCKLVMLAPFLSLMIDERDFNSTEPLETIQDRRCGRISLRYRGTIPNVKRWSTEHSFENKWGLYWITQYKPRIPAKEIEKSKLKMQN